ncbi:MAG: polyisoprenoid-binding protein [Candidatus Omnitrophica bacterium CG11_big_fil_rev_8_21_14_0_20_64_10]|nr:MAG: polyisoprenoid-binding protein [Candidatus Omnitrophica bacterium CG11_big_fil_rev_8_21_14_0_20_64_10]
MRFRLFGLILASALLSAPAAWAASYTLDADHTTIQFKIRHLLTPVAGSFNQLEGSFDYEPDHPESWKVQAVIQAASIDTRVSQRDEHLRSADFFEAEKYPTITFESRKISGYDKAAGAAKLEGDLTIRGITRPVILDLEIHGVADDPWGNTRAGFTATGKINRKDFGLNWNQALETGQLLVGEEVQILLEVEGIRQ